MAQNIYVVLILGLLALLVILSGGILVWLGYALIQSPESFSSVLNTAVVPVFPVIGGLIFSIRRIQSIRYEGKLIYPKDGIFYFVMYYLGLLTAAIGLLGIYAFLILVIYSVTLSKNLPLNGIGLAMGMIVLLFGFILVESSREKEI